MSATIWVDADACPTAIKQMLYRAASRVKVSLILVANHYFSVPSSPLIRLVQVEKGFDQADGYIEQRVASGDLVITSDIPLAADVIEKGAVVVGFHGQKYTQANIKQRLQMRNFLEQMRNAGEDVGGGPSAFSQADKHQFAQALDAWLNKNTGTHKKGDI